jgi:hypothetical protein
MPYPHDVPKAAWLPAVTNIRASGDYASFEDQPHFGGAALLYDAHGVLPLKDGFNLPTRLQVSEQNIGPELKPDLHAPMATLSTAMAGPMNGINLLNARKPAEDGITLKPDRPQKTVGTWFRRGQHRIPDKLLMYVKEIAVQGINPLVFYLLDDASAVTGGLLPEKLELPTSQVEDGKFLVLGWYSGIAVLWLSGSTPLATQAAYEGHAYQHHAISPLLNFGGSNGGGLAFFGESTTKYVPCLALRFSAVVPVVGHPQLVATEVGVANETVPVCVAAEVGGWAVWCKRVSFEKNGALEVKLP